MLRGIMEDEALRFEALMESEKLTQTERKRFQKSIKLDENGEFAMSGKPVKLIRIMSV